MRFYFEYLLIGPKRFLKNVRIEAPFYPMIKPKNKRTGWDKHKRKIDNRKRKNSESNQNQQSKRSFTSSILSQNYDLNLNLDRIDPAPFEIEKQNSEHAEDHCTDNNCKLCEPQPDYEKLNNISEYCEFYCGKYLFKANARTISETVVHGSAHRTCLGSGSSGCVDAITLPGYKINSKKSTSSTVKFIDDTINSGSHDDSKADCRKEFAVKRISITMESNRRVPDFFTLRGDFHSGKFKVVSKHPFSKQCNKRSRFGSSESFQKNNISNIIMETKTMEQATEEFWKRDFCVC